MTGSTSVSVGTIKYEGRFDWEGLYQAVADWFEKYEFQWQEEKFEHKGDSQKIEWSGERKETEYIKISINVKFSVGNMEVIDSSNGKIVKGKITVDIDGEVTYDWQGTFEKNNFTQFIGDIYNNYIIDGKIGKYKGKLSDRISGLHSFIKKYLDMETSAHGHSGFLGENKKYE